MVSDDTEERQPSDLIDALVSFSSRRLEEKARS
jgi:hypothetical protein